MTLTELRKIAESATPGEWWFMTDGLKTYLKCRGVKFRNDLIAMIDRVPSDAKEWAENNFKFIATFNPARVLKLLEQLEIAKEALLKYDDSGTYFDVVTRDSPSVITLDDSVREHAREALSRMEELEK